MAKKPLGSPSKPQAAPASCPASKEASGHKSCQPTPPAPCHPPPSFHCAQIKPLGPATASFTATLPYPGPIRCLARHRSRSWTVCWDPSHQSGSKVKPSHWVRMTSGSWSPGGSCRMHLEERGKRCATGISRGIGPVGAPRGASSLQAEPTWGASPMGWEKLSVHGCTCFPMRAVLCTRAQPRLQSPPPWTLIESSHGLSQEGACVSGQKGVGAPPLQSPLRNLATTQWAF